MATKAHWIGGSTGAPGARFVEGVPATDLTEEQFDSFSPLQRLFICDEKTLYRVEGVTKAREDAEAEYLEARGPVEFTETGAPAPHNSGAEADFLVQGVSPEVTAAAEAEQQVNNDPVLVPDETTAPDPAEETPASSGGRSAGRTSK